MAVVARVAELLQAAPDSEVALRTTLEACLDRVGAARAIALVVDVATGRLYGTLGVDILGQRGETKPIPLAPARHPLSRVLRDTTVTHFGPRDLARASLAALRRLGFREAIVVPIAMDTTISPCLAAGRCLSRRCIVGERTPSSSPDDVWQDRVARACVRATVLAAPAAVVIDAPDPGPEARVELQEIAAAAAGSLRRFRELPWGAADMPAAEIEEEWVRRAFAAVDDPVLVADAQATLRFTNGAAHRLFVAQPGDAPGRRRAIDLNRMLLGAWLTSYLGVRDTDRPRELGLVDPDDGGELLFELLTSTAFNRSARETATVLRLKDVSDLRHTLDELESTVRRMHAEADAARRQREQIDAILEGIEQPVLVADPRTESTEGALASGVIDVVTMNAAARRLLQGPGENVKRNNAVITSFLSQASIRGADSSSEVVLSGSNGDRPRTYTARASITRGAHGAPAAIVCVLGDLTEIRELERRRVERQLFESEKLAATGRLAATFAHEINNPLEAMKNALYVLAAELPEEHPGRRFVDIARTETERISRTVRQILGFYRPSIAKAPVDLNAVVRDVVELLASQMRKARVTSGVELAPDAPRVVASGDQMRQVLLNLMLNGIQAMPRGGELSVRTRRLADGAPGPGGVIGPASMLVEVSDTGQGIAPELQSRLFEPFVTTKELTGTGLGLWVCREIVQAHGGSISLQSAPGEGTTVRIVLPVQSLAVEVAR